MLRYGEIWRLSGVRPCAFRISFYIRLDLIMDFDTAVKSFQKLSTVNNQTTLTG